MGVRCHRGQRTFGELPPGVFPNPDYATLRWPAVKENRSYRGCNSMGFAWLSPSNGAPAGSDRAGAGQHAVHDAFAADEQVQRGCGDVAAHENQQRSGQRLVPASTEWPAVSPTRPADLSGIVNRIVAANAQLGLLATAIGANAPRRICVLRSR
jgi:hypothetical protein